MKKEQTIGLVVAVFLFILTGVTSVFTNTLAENTLKRDVTEILSGGMNLDLPTEDYVGVVNISGVIQEQVDTSFTQEGYLHTSTMDYIDSLMADDNNVGISLYVDSPGGTVYESEEMYLKLMEYKETGRPIWCYMSHYAASGGYMIPMSSDYICANPNTVTGSIGVIMSGYDMTGLYEKLGIRYVSITSGVNKDSSQLTEEQIAIYQAQVDECYEKFVEIVAEGRGMTVDEVKTLADGRTYTAKQALENGLIDEVESYQYYCDYVSGEAGTDIFYEPESGMDLLSSIFGEVSRLIPKSEAQILMEAAKELESGVPMYYAEQLR